MQDFSYLALATIHCFPFLSSLMHHVRILNLKKGKRLDLQIDNHVMIYCITGSGKGNFVNERICADRDFSFQKKALIYLEPIGFVNLVSATDNLKLLIVEFSIFSASLDAPVSPDAIPENYFQNNTPVKKQNLSLNLPFLTTVEDYSFMYITINNFLKEIVNNSENSILSIQRIFPAFIIHWLRVSQREIDEMLHLVDSVWISSDMAYHESIKAGQTLWVSDIEIWNGHPDNTDSYLLGSFTTTDVYMSDIWKGSRWINEVSAVCGSVGRISTDTDSEYSLLMFPKIKGNELNLKPFRSTCYLRFFLKSNVSFKLGVAVYSCKSFRGIGHAFEYTNPGEWQEQIVPVLSSYQALRISSHIDKAIEYIKKEYANPIRRHDIAKYACIRPEYLSELFKQQLGTSVSSYINKIRLLESLELLKDPNLSIENIAFTTGFYDAVHFSKSFQKQYKMRPSTYRKQRSL